MRYQIGPKSYAWPGGARLALSVVVNVEEGAEFNVLDGDGTYGNPFWAPRFETRAYMQAVFTLDKLYDAIFHAGEGGGGDWD